MKQIKTYRNQKSKVQACDTRAKCSECVKKCPQFWKKARKHKIVIHMSELHNEHSKIIRKIVHFRCANIEVEDAVIRMIRRNRKHLPFNIMFLFSYIWNSEKKNCLLNEVEIEMFDLETASVQKSLSLYSILSGKKHKKLQDPNPYRTIFQVNPYRMKG